MLKINSLIIKTQELKVALATNMIVDYYLACFKKIEAHPVNKKKLVHVVGVKHGFRTFFTFLHLKH